MFLHKGLTKCYIFVLLSEKWKYLERRYVSIWKLMRLCVAWTSYFVFSNITHFITKNPQVILVILENHQYSGYHAYKYLFENSVCVLFNCSKFAKLRFVKFKVLMLPVLQLSFHYCVEAVFIIMLPKMWLQRKFC